MNYHQKSRLKKFTIIFSLLFVMSGCREEVHSLQHQNEKVPSSLLGRWTASIICQEQSTAPYQEPAEPYFGSSSLSGAQYDDLNLIFLIQENDSAVKMSTYTDEGLCVYNERVAINFVDDQHFTLIPLPKTKIEIENVPAHCSLRGSTPLVSLLGFDDTYRYDFLGKEIYAVSDSDHYCSKVGQAGTKAKLILTPA